MGQGGEGAGAGAAVVGRAPAPGRLWWGGHQRLLFAVRTRVRSRGRGDRIQVGEVEGAGTGGGEASRGARVGFFLVDLALFE